MPPRHHLSRHHQAFDLKGFSQTSKGGNPGPITAEICIFTKTQREKKCPKANSWVFPKIVVPKKWMVYNGTSH